MSANNYDVYIAGSLRSKTITDVHLALQAGGCGEVFSSWFTAGPEADDYWKTYEQTMGFTYRQALKRPAAQNVFHFDKRHIDASEAFVLVCPAGKSAHLELGYHLGKGKPGYILLDPDDVRWDVMYNFATGVTDSVEELIQWLRK